MKVVGSKPIFYAGYLTFASDIVKPNLRGQGTFALRLKCVFITARNPFPLIR